MGNTAGADRTASGTAVTERLTHPIPPLYDADSRVLILGSFPSVKSREQAFFYAHPQNRFWRLLSGLLGEPCPVRVEEKRTLLHASHIALWDVIASCEITGSSDSSIRSAVPNDLRPILETADIQAIFCNGATAYTLYCKYIKNVIGRNAIRLPSTSPANAAFSMEKLAESWKNVLNYL